MGRKQSYIINTNEVLYWKKNTDYSLCGLINRKAVQLYATKNVKCSLPQIPGALHKGVSEKLASLSQGQQPDVTGNCHKFKMA